MVNVTAPPTRIKPPPSFPRPALLPLRAWTWYRGHLLTTRPCLANAINTGVVMGLGDIIAQVMLEGKNIKDIDIIRFIRFTCVGFFIAGPGMHHFYSLLDHKIISGSLRMRTFKKLCCDQIFFLPFYLFLYLVIMAALRGDSPETIKQKVGRDYFEGLMVSYQVWPVVQIVNFYLVPSRFRVLLINVVALFWNTYLGWKAEQILPLNGDEKIN